MATPFDRSIICPVLIGRTSTLQTLHTLIEQTKAKSGGMLLISGEAGVGKSRLVAEAKSYARQQGFASLQGNCFQPDVTYPYAPLIDLLRHAFATEHGAKQMQLSPTSLRQLSRLLPDLFPPPEAITGAITEGEQDKYRLFAALLQVFAALAAQQPLLVTIEDVHWSDNISLEFLHQLARWSTTQPLLVLVTYRNDEIGASLSRWLAQLDREHLIREIALTPLNPSEVGELIKAIFELRRPVRADFLETIQVLTEGNPFFVEEVLKSLILAGDIFYSNDTWDRKALNELHIPRSVQDAVQQRVEQLSPTAKQLIVIAAAAGRRFDFALLRALTQQDEYELISAIKEMIGAQLVVEESAERFAFRHALTRQAIYADLLFRERLLLHRRIAEALQSIYATAPDSHLAELAYHFYEAKRWQRAFEICWRAGEQARQLYAFPAAAEHFTHALEAVKQLEISAPLSLLQARGLVYEAYGDFELARIDHERVIEMAQAAADRQVECQAYLDLGMLWASQDYGKTGLYYRQALQLAREVEVPSLIAHSLNRLGNWYMNHDQHMEGQKYHQEALVLFQELDDMAGRAMTLDMLGLARYGSGDLVQAAHDLEQAIELFQRLKDRASLASSLTMLMLCRRENYESATVVSAVDDSAKTAAIEELAYQISHEIGWPSREAFALFEIGLSVGVRGDYGRAFAVTEKGLRMVEEIEHQQWMTLGYRVLALIYLDLLAFPEAERHLLQALALAHKIGSLFFGYLASGQLASLYVRERQFEKAEAILSDLLPADVGVNADGAPKLDKIYPSLGLRIAWSARAELALATHHPEVALAIVEELIASLDNNASQNPPPYLLKLKGEALAGLQRWQEAQSALESARQRATERGLRSRLWRIHVALGNLFQAQKRQGEAEDAWFAARQLIAELSTEISDVALRENFVRSAKAMMPDANPPRAARPEEKTLNGLTAREREVAALIAEGKSNQEIADSLIVGYRTVETHVSHILSKLGFSTRSQIARWALENGARR